MYDADLMSHKFINELAFLTNNWKSSLGRPTLTYIVKSTQRKGKSPEVGPFYVFSVSLAFFTQIRVRTVILHCLYLN